MYHNLLKYLCIFSLIGLVLTPYASCYSASDFFTEDFNSFPLTNWLRYGSSSGVAVSGGELKITSYSSVRFAYNFSYVIDFRMEVKFHADANSQIYIGISSNMSGDSLDSASNAIYFKRVTAASQPVQFCCKNGSSEIELASFACNSYNQWCNVTLLHQGDNYLAYVNENLIYNDSLYIPFTNDLYTFSFSGYVSLGYTYTTLYLDYFYTQADLCISESSSIDIFTAISIDNATINLTSQILKIFIDVKEAALVVGNIIVDNLIDTITAVIKIGQSVLTIIAQASTQIYSRLITIISQAYTYIQSGIVVIIDKVISAINSFSAIIDNIITILKTYYDEDTVYGTIIRVIPLILLLSIPTLVVYYKIGEFATIPMFMFMAVVAYATSLMPLWILIVALIGCIAILMQKRAKA